MPAIEIGNLTAKEDSQLLAQLRDSNSGTVSPKPRRPFVPLAPAQREELDRRLDELDQEGPGGIPWAEVYQRNRRRAP